MINFSVSIGMIALLSTNASARKLRTRACSITWPANEGDTCANFVDNWGISEAQFLSYNPGTICPSLEVGKEYCVEWSGTPPNLPLSPTPTPSPLILGDHTTLVVVTTARSLSKSASPTRIAGTCSSTPAGVTTLSPVQTGLTCGCTKFYKVIEGNGCWDIAKSNGISLADFYAWNPALAPDCKNLFPNDYACVAKGSSNPMSSSKPTTTISALMVCKFDPKTGQYICSTPSLLTTRPATTTAGSHAPGPTQTGIPGKCNKWVLQKDGVYCLDMAKAAGITLDMLYSLNPSLNKDYSGLWPGYAYCVGTSQ